MADLTMKQFMLMKCDADDVAGDEHLIVGESRYKTIMMRGPYMRKGGKSFTFDDGARYEMSDLLEIVDDLRECDNRNCGTGPSGDEAIEASVGAAFVHLADDVCSLEVHHE